MVLHRLQHRDSDQGRAARELHEAGRGAVRADICRLAGRGAGVCRWPPGGSRYSFGQYRPAGPVLDGHALAGRDDLLGHRRHGEPFRTVCRGLLACPDVQGSACLFPRGAGRPGCRRGGVRVDRDRVPRSVGTLPQRDHRRRLSGGLLYPGRRTPRLADPDAGRAGRHGGVRRRAGQRQPQPVFRRWRRSGADASNGRLGYGGDRRAVVSRYQDLGGVRSIFRNARHGRCRAALVT